MTDPLGNPVFDAHTTIPDDVVDGVNQALYSAGNNGASSSADKPVPKMTTTVTAASSKTTDD